MIHNLRLKKQDNLQFKSVCPKFMALFLLVAGCGAPVAIDPSKGKSSLLSEQVTTSFQEWCQSWKLMCDTERSEPKNEMQEQKWNALLTIVRAGLSDELKLNLSSKDLTDEKLMSAFDEMGLSELTQKMRSLIEKSDLQTIEILGNSALGINLAGEQQKWNGTSGLQWEVQSQSKVVVGQNSNIELNGFNFLSSDNIFRESLKGVSFDSVHGFSWKNESLKVTNVPTDFFMKDLGFDVTKFGDVRLSALIKNLPTLIEWSQQTKHTFSLGEKFFSTLARHGEKLADSPETKLIFSQIAPHLLRMNTLDSQGKTFLDVTLREQKGLNCKFEVEGVPGMNLLLSSDFGIRSYGKNEQDHSRFTFFGIEAKVDIPGPFDPSFTLKEVDIEPDRITIRQVPIVGKISIPFKDGGSDKSRLKSLACADRS